MINYEGKSKEGIHGQGKVRLLRPLLLNLTSTGSRESTRI